MIMETAQFESLAAAESFLKSQGFWLVANNCAWTNMDGDGAGCYGIEGRYGAVRAWRVEIVKCRLPAWAACIP